MSAAKKTGTIKIQWVVSFVGCTRDMRSAIRGLGFRRMQQTVEREDTPSIRGMVRKVRHLVKIVEGN
jgi:large subunit ribosomal protein L30